MAVQSVRILSRARRLKRGGSRLCSGISGSVHDIKMPYSGVGGALISLSQTIEPVGGCTTESVTHGQCDVRPTVTFPASENHRPLAGSTKLLVTEAHVCEQLAQGQEKNSWLQIQCLNHYTTSITTTTTFWLIVWTSDASVLNSLFRFICQLMRGHCFTVCYV